MTNPRGSLELKTLKSSTSKQKGSTSSKISSVKSYSSQEDDAPTRVFAKRATQSNAYDALPLLQRATTRERDTQSNDRENKRIIPYYIRDLGDKVSPGLDDVRRQAGLRTDSTLTETNHVPVSTDAGHLEITSMDVMHNWTQEVRDEEFVATINILKKGRASSPQPEGRIVWIHVQDSLPSLDRLEKLFKAHLAKRVQPFVAETTTSLFNRVKITRERKLVSGTLGRFLLPGVTRYSARSNQTGNEDHPCLFLSFPYLFLGRLLRDPPSSHDKAEKWHDHHHQHSIMQSSHIRQKGQANTSLATDDVEAQKFGHHHNEDCLADDEDEESEKQYHPPRTLLQSRYRLESTKSRDRNQAIFSLTAKQLKDCISRPSRHRKTQPYANISSSTKPSNEHEKLDSAAPKWPWSLRKKQKRERLYIPQLWSLSLSGDVMLTYSPIGIEDLCGSALVRRDFELGDSKTRHSLVRFVVQHDDHEDDIFIYPASSCEWFYGLINKQRKVESHLDAQGLGRSTSGNQTPNNLHYNIVYRRSTDEDQIVDCNNWLEIQSEHTESNLDLFLEYHKSPDINVNGLTISTNRRSSISGNVSHARSVSNPIAAATIVSPTSPTSPRFLLAPQSPDQRARSASSSVRSISPSGINNPTWPDRHSSFFEWRFLEEVTQDPHVSSDRTTQDRVDAWLAKVFHVVYCSHGHDMDDSLKIPATRVSLKGRAKLRKAIGGMEMASVQEQFFPRSGSAPLPIKDTSSTLSTEAQRIFSTAKELLKMYIPKDYLNPDEVGQMNTLAVQGYWGLLGRILDGIVAKSLNDVELKYLSRTLSGFLDLAKQIHRGVWQMNDDKTDPRNVTTVNSAVIYMPIANALEHIYDLFFEVIKFMEVMDPPVISADRSFENTIDAEAIRVRKHFERTERFLIQGGEENRYRKNLGPVVTPEAITILLLRRLFHGVYRDGTVNVIEIFERIVERLATKVERSASRFLLLEINRVTEEIDIILENFKEQKDFLESYRDYLDPKIIENPNVKRKTRFEYEQVQIERFIDEVRERIQDCQELQSHVKRLADQNLQLVEGGQDDINKKLMLFTLVTIVFLPPSFVTSFFGMNLQGIDNTTYGVGHFWGIALPLTGGLLLVSVIILYWSAWTSIVGGIWTWITSDQLDDE